MADYSFGGTEEENAELKKLNTEVLEDPDSFENWEKLVRAAESLEGGLNRNSSPQSIGATRDIYDRFLAKFPLLFGYWKKYADLEFSIAGTEAAELVYERGVASITNSVDLWTNYCAFKVETSHDSDVIRELFERSAVCVGLDFLAHPFWDKYLEFEERLEAHDKIFAILDRVVHIPMHQYARYFERYRHLAQIRPLQELLPADMLAQFRTEIEAEGPATVQAGSQVIKAERGELEIEREMRTRIDNFHLEIFSRTQTETTKRWTYESEVKRPYFHVTELDEGQLVNWRKYLDFEEIEGDYVRTQFLYERCLVTCAYYDEFWLRYARWMLHQPGKEEEVRNVYQRASMLYVPISRPAVRLQYAYFEEMSDRVELAKDIHQAILVNLPGHIETIISLANTSRRHGGLEAAIEVYKAQIDLPQCDIYAKAALVAEWARLLWKVKGSVDEARQVFQKNQHWYLDSRAFWINFLLFELEQPTSSETEATQYKRIKQVHDDIRRKSHLPPLTVKDLTHYYMVYLLERGTKDAAKEYMMLDREVNGPYSVQTVAKMKAAEDGREATTQRRLMMENGHPGVEVDEAAIRRGENPYTKYYQQQGEQQLPSDAQSIGGKMLSHSNHEPHLNKNSMPPPKPKKLKRARKRDSGGPYICALCNKGFTRRATVKEPHFATCVAKHGNPHHLAWDAHESCWAKRPGRKVGSSAGAVPGVEWNYLEDENEGGDGDWDNDLDEEHHQPDFIHSATYQETGYKDKDVEENIHEMVKTVGWNSVNNPLPPTLGQCLPYNSSSTTYSSSPHLLPAIVMNQLANIPIMACRTRAGEGILEARRMWELWNDMLPDDALSYVGPPPDGSSEKARQQAVVWMAQDVYAGLLRHVHELADQLKMVAVWRDIVTGLGDTAGVEKIHDLLITAFGENGPFMLNGFDI
ncbi:hypothetical protein MMC07_006291 [Pseudocyphellaria aurata]|nr:hypothetical protein [Pseudocyphellaria aurata]